MPRAWIEDREPDHVLRERYLKNAIFHSSVLPNRASLGTLPPTTLPTDNILKNEVGLQTIRRKKCVKISKATQELEQKQQRVGVSLKEQSIQRRVDPVETRPDAASDDSWIGCPVVFAAPGI